MYEIFRNDLIAKLHGVLDDDTMQKVLHAVDDVATAYCFQKSETQLAVVGRKDLLDAISLYFIVRQQEGMSPNSVKMDETILHSFAMRCTVPMKDITSNMIRSYLYTYQQERGISQRTLELYRCVICTFFKWLSAEGYIPADITVVIKRFKYAKKPRKALTQIQLQDVRGVCKSSKQRALVEMLYSTGCRISELVNIKQSEIDWSKKQVMVIGKGNKPRVVYINAKAEKAVKAYWMESCTNEAEWLFTCKRTKSHMSKAMAQKMFRNLRDRLGLAKGQLVPHTMRHTMATQAATVCPIQQVQAMLGHSSINTTMIYAETNAEQVKAGHKLAVI